MRYGKWICSQVQELQLDSWPGCSHAHQPAEAGPGCCWEKSQTAGPGRCIATNLAGKGRSRSAANATPQNFLDMAISNPLLGVENS